MVKTKDSVRDFEGLVALVTGAGSGIGLATSRVLSERGAVVVALDRDPSAATNPLNPIVADVTDQESVTRAVAQVMKQFQRLDVVVNNAGIGSVGTVTDNDDSEWHHVWDVNVVGIARVMRAAIDHLRRSPSAAVVNTCSIAATAGLPQRALYSATKGAVQALTLAMAADYIADGVRVNCVNPGTADTPWVERLLAAAHDPQAERRALEARQPMGRLVSADEVAEAIAYLTSPRSASTTGTVLAVDGGMHGLRLRR